jgi:hypothetical protein
MFFLINTYSYFSLTNICYMEWNITFPVTLFTHIVCRKFSNCQCSYHDSREYRNFSSYPCFTGRNESLYLRPLDNIARVVPLTIINSTFIKASECDQLSIQVRKTNVLALNEWTLLLFGWLLRFPFGWWNKKMHRLKQEKDGWRGY